MSESGNGELGVSRGIVRAVLGILGGVQVVNGLYALLAPSSFYGDFPLGRGWVEALPAYSEHLVRDVGSLFLATGIVLLAAVVWTERRLVQVALVSYLAFALPHAIYHAFNLEPYGTGDAIANVVTLGFTAIAPIALLIAMRRPGTRVATAGAAPPDGVGRIAGVPDSVRSPLVRYAYRDSRRRTGEVMEPLRIWAHSPTLLAAYGAFELGTERVDRVPERLKHLGELRAAMLAGCEWCLDYGSAISTAANVSEEDLRALPNYATSGRFDETERLVLDYASGMSRTPVDVPEELFAALRERFDAAQLVELTNIIALENHRARFNWAFGLAGQGFTDGAYCVRPEGEPGTAASVDADY